MKRKIGSVLVVGGGIGGIRSALDLAEQGYRVVLIDRKPNLGGALSQLDYQFPSDHCGMCKMLPLVERDAGSQFCLRKGLFHENIEVRLSTELVGLEGEPGKFKAVLRRKPVFVDSDRCVGCGECARVCPVEVSDAFNAGLIKRKAVYLPTPHSIPNSYVVDATSCIRCGECEEVCPTGAIDLRIEARRAFRILVVDDELIVRHSTKEWLEEDGFRVDMAESGADALEKLSAQTYNLMLLDVKMPGMDGVEVLRRAKEMYPELPVVMMTAYATVETAVEAMKIGAMEYLMKPFDPEAMSRLVEQLYRSFKGSDESLLDVGAVILSTGFESFIPPTGENTYGYGEFPDVVTGMEFERMMSGSGPNRGRLIRPSDGKEVRKVAWIQCVGSRDLHINTDCCSSVCCMFSIKEALLAKERSGGEVDAAIFYMDMRTFGKGFQRYRDGAETEHGVRFVRSRVHSVEFETESNSLRLHYVDITGAPSDEVFDIAVLATGQRAPEGTAALAETLGIELNPMGFCRVKDFSLSRTTKEGVFVGGSFSGLRDISESVVQASSASLAASTLIHSKGGGLAEAETDASPYRDVSRESPQTAVVLCKCGNTQEESSILDEVAKELKDYGWTDQISQVERMCTQDGWNKFVEQLKGSRANRLLIGACQPCVYGNKLGLLGKSVGLSPHLMDVVDIRTPVFSMKSSERTEINRIVLGVLAMGIAGLRNVDPNVSNPVGVIQKALVVGGGIAGMTAALAIADHGFEVILVEQAEELGGNLRNIHYTIDGLRPKKLLESTITRLERRPNITVYKKSRVVHSQGWVGSFLTSIEKSDGSGVALEHGVTILATGGEGATTRSYAYGQNDAIVTQHELEERLHSGSLKPADLRSVVMIQCVDSREADRRYCSRICCASALKNALFLKDANPELDIYIFYRDIMAYGLLESYYTRARRTGILFIQYTPDGKPKVKIEDGQISVTGRDPILGRDLVLKPDLLALSTGIVPALQAGTAETFGVEMDSDGFFHEAESKWRPVDFVKAGVFMCGIAHSPKSIQESIASAEAAAQRALGIIGNQQLASGKNVAEVRESFCSLCERCIDACPYGARWLDEEEEKIVVNVLACQGCGSCAAVCPNSASVLRGFSDRRMLSVIDEALGAF